MLLLDDEIIHSNDYLLVKFPTKKRTLYYIGKVKSCNNNYSYVLNFMRKYGNGFRFPDLEDISTVFREDIVSKLLNPVTAPGTSRTGSLLNFHVHFNNYNVQ